MVNYKEENTINIYLWIGTNLKIHVFFFVCLFVFFCVCFCFDLIIYRFQLVMTSNAEAVEDMLSECGDGAKAARELATYCVSLKR